MQVPADGRLDRRAWSAIESTDVDGLINIGLPPDLAEATSKALVEGGASHPDALRLVDPDNGIPAIHPADLAASALTVDGSNGFVIAATDAPLWHAAAAGDLTATHENRARGVGNDVQPHTAAGFER